MFEIAPELKLFRQFNHQFYRLFQKGITKQQTRYRHTQMIHNQALIVVSAIWPPAPGVMVKNIVGKM